MLPDTHRTHWEWGKCVDVHIWNWTWTRFSGGFSTILSTPLYSTVLLVALIYCSLLYSSPSYASLLCSLLCWSLLYFSLVFFLFSLLCIVNLHNSEVSSLHATGSSEHATVHKSMRRQYEGKHSGLAAFLGVVHGGIPSHHSTHWDHLKSVADYKISYHLRKLFQLGVCNTTG